MRTVRFIAMAVVALAALHLFVRTQETDCAAAARQAGFTESHWGFGSGCRIGPLDPQAPRTN